MMGNMVIFLLIVLIASFILKVMTKNSERRRAEAVALALANANEDEMIALLREMVPQLTTTSEIVKALEVNLFFLANPIAWCYDLLTLSTVVVDARTPSVPVLWESQEQLLNLHDFDVLDALDEWKDALRRDIFMLRIFVVAALFLFFVISGRL